MTTINIRDYADVLRFAEKQCGDQLLVDIQRFEQEEDEEKRIVFLETTNALSHDFILYLAFHEREFFTKHIHPLLEDRSNLVFDLFCYYFAGFAPSAEQLAAIASKVEHQFCLYTTGAQQFNGCEIALLLIMRSYYADVEACLSILQANEIPDRKVRLNRRLMDMKDEEQEQEEQEAMGFGANHVEDRVIEEFDQLYVERLWYSDGYEYENVPFTSFWHAFVEEHIKKTSMDTQAFLETIVLDTAEAKRLAVACVNFEQPLNYVVENEQAADLAISIQATVTLEHPRANRILRLAGVLEVQCSDFSEALICWKLPEGLLSEDLEEQTDDEVHLVPGTNKLLVQRELSCFVNELGPIRAVLIAKERELEFAVEIDAEPLEQLLETPTVDAQLEFATAANASQQCQQIMQFLQVSEFQSLLYNKKLTEQLEELYLDAQLSDPKLYEKFQFLIAYIHGDAEGIGMLLEREFCGIRSMHLEQFDGETNYDITLRPVADLLIEDNTLQGNLLEASLSGLGIQTYAGLRLKQHCDVLTIPERNELAQLLFAQGRFEQACGLVDGIENSVSQLFVILCNLATRKATLDDLRAYRERNLQLLNDRNARIIAEMLGETEEKPFIVTQDRGTLEFTKHPVHLRLWKKTVFYNAQNCEQVLPHHEFDVDDSKYTLNEPGNFIIECQCEFDKCIIEVNNTEITWTADSSEGILQVEGATIENKYYCQVKSGGEFYKDGFTDAHGRFDYFTVSDRHSSQGPLDITVIGKNGDFVEFSVESVGEVVFEQEPPRVEPVGESGRRRPILPK